MKNDYFLERGVRANNLYASLWVKKSEFQPWLRSLCHVFRQNSFLSASGVKLVPRIAHRTFCHFKKGLQSGLQFVFYSWSEVCILPLVCSLYFTPGLQSAFYSWSAVCILPLVCSLYFTPGLQSVFYPWCTVCILS